MNFFIKAYSLARMAKVALTWNRRNTHYRCQIPGNPKFMGPRDAVKLIPDGAVIATSGLGANQRPSILYWAIREVFEETGCPCNLTVMSTGGQGGRGRVPGTIEELGRPGLCTRLITGHVETYKSILHLAEQGEAELQCLPQGVMALLFEAQGRGEDSLLTGAGVNTFMDPRVGRGTPLAGRIKIDTAGANAEQWVAAEGDKLRFRLPKVGVALFNAYAADREGNIYVTHCPMKAEIREIARAAKRNGGHVIANVSCVVAKGFDDIYVPAEDVDAVVVYPRTEQSGFVPYRKHLAYLTPKSRLSTEEGIQRARFSNRVMGITPRRSAMDQVLARLAADVFVRTASAGALVNIGVGMPEEVCLVLHRHGILDHITLFTESGVIGGVPAPGIFFGAAVNPSRIISSAEVFRMCEERLDTAIVGALQADGDGNVNVSKRAERISRYVGPGGLIDLTTAAKTVIFVTKWMEGEKMRLAGPRVRIVEAGKPKFVSQVDEVTFSGKEALKAGKQVFYVTTVGVFQLTQRGMELICVMPGLDIRSDIMTTTSMRIVAPETRSVPLIEESILTGKGFRPRLRDLAFTVKHPL